MNPHSQTKQKEKDSSVPPNPRFNSPVPDYWKEVEPLAPSHIYPAGTELFHQGSLASDVYFIDRGLVKLVRIESDGRELIVGLRSPGWILGAAPVIAKKEHPVTGITIISSSLRLISGQVFCDLLRNSSQFSWKLHEIQSLEILDDVSRLAQFGSCSARNRLEQLLWQLVSALQVETNAKTVQLQLPLKQWEIAELIAVTPAYLSRLFDQLEKEGVIHRRKGWFIVPSPQELWHTTAYLC
jgi:CRP/FNR family cyclic AMP-dependent transcriptional regulator